MLPCSSRQLWAGQAASCAVVFRTRKLQPLQLGACICEQSALPILLPFPCATSESSGICRNGIHLISTSDELLVGHCKGNTPSDVSKSHVVAVNWTTAGDADFLSTLRPLISQLLSAAALAYASLAFPGSALPLAGTSVCTTVKDQSHQDCTKTKLARISKKEPQTTKQTSKQVHFNLDQFLNPVLPIIGDK